MRNIKYRIFLVFRKVLCAYGIHDFECEYTAPDGAMLYCFYCGKNRWSTALPTTKEEALKAYNEWLALGGPGD